MKRLIAGLLVLFIATTASAFNYERPADTGGTGNPFGNISGVSIKLSGALESATVTTSGNISAGGDVAGTQGNFSSRIKSTSFRSTSPTDSFTGFSTDFPITLQHRNFTADNSIAVSIARGTFSNSSGTGTPVAILPTYNQVDSVSANTDLLVNRTETLVGTGDQLLIDLQVGGVSKFRVDNSGYVRAQAGMLSDRFSPYTVASDLILRLQNDSYDLSFRDSSDVEKFSIDSSGNVRVGNYIYANVLTPLANQTQVINWGQTYASSNVGVQLLDSVTFTSTAGVNVGVQVSPIYNQASGDAANTDFKISRSVTNVGSGAQLLFDAQTDDVSQFSIDPAGTTNVGGAPIFSGWSSISTDYAIDDDIFFIACDAALGNISTTLPAVAGVPKGRMLEVKLTSATNGCYIDANGAETIDGVTGKDITVQWNTISLIAAGSQWFIK